MPRTGTVIEAGFSGFDYPNQRKPGERIYRHNVKIQMADGQVYPGVYDSVKQDQAKFVVGQNIEFDTEIKEDKGGNKYNKFKPVYAKPGSGGGGFKDDPLVRAQIQRSSCLKRVPEIIEAFKTTNPTLEVVPGALVKVLNHWVVAVGKDVRQSSINAQAALESATRMIVIKNITNEDHLLEYAHQLFEYIQNG